MTDVTLFRKPILRVAVLALCTTALTTLPMLAQAPAPASQDQAGPQQGGRGARMEERQVEMLTKRLNLTPDQATQVKAIDDDSRKQSMAVRDDSSVTDKRAKMMEIRKASQDKIRAVLTDDQKTRYDALLAEMRERRENHQGAGGAPPQQ